MLKNMQMQEDHDNLKNQLRNQLNNEKYQNEYQSQGESDDIENTNFMVNKPNEEAINQKLLKESQRQLQRGAYDTQPNIKQEKQNKKVQKNKIGSGLISPKAYAGQSPDIHLNIPGQFEQESNQSNEIVLEQSMDEEQVQSFYMQ